MPTKTYVRLLNGQINAYRKNPFKSQPTYKYISTTIEMDGFCYYDLEADMIKRKPQEEIDAILEQQRINELNIEKTRIIALITDNIDLLKVADFAIIEAYRNYDIEIATLIENSIPETPLDFEQIEKDILKMIIIYKTDMFTEEELAEKSILELTTILISLTTV